MKQTIAFTTLVMLALIAGYFTACGSGYEVEKGNAPEIGETIGTITGVINYQGEKTGQRLVVGIIEDWPMDKPPVRFYEILDFDGIFPVPYEFELDDYLEDKGFYFAAFLDVDPDDINLMMNAELDPMDLPKEDEQKTVIHSGVNVRDFVLLDPEDVDWWWDDSQ